MRRETKDELSLSGSQHGRNRVDGKDQVIIIIEKEKQIL